MKLFIAEKPAVANDIVKALGGNFTRHDGWFESDNTIVTNCFGHIIESQPPKTIILNTKSGRLKHSLCVFIP
uniref:DNA topoisomerase 3 n=1 Tax=Escherichia coli TaxID=562 RepID=A0A1U9XHX3_ECOLX|nr:DNA topoisomerase 3 [Escherichia coli]